MDTAASYSSLEPTSKRGRKRQHWKLQRVGIKAAKLREAAAARAPPLPSTPAAMEPTLKAGTYQYLKQNK